MQERREIRFVLMVLLSGQLEPFLPASCLLKLERKSKRRWSGNHATVVEMKAVPAFFTSNIGCLAPLIHCLSVTLRQCLGNGWPNRRPPARQGHLFRSPF